MLLRTRNFGIDILNLCWTVDSSSVMHLLEPVNKCAAFRLNFYFPYIKHERRLMISSFCVYICRKDLNLSYGRESDYFD
jgi:hypothetical protein